MTAEHYLKEGVDKVSENKIATTCSHTGQQSEEVDIKAFASLVLQLSQEEADRRDRLHTSLIPSANRS